MRKHIRLSVLIISTFCFTSFILNDVEVEGVKFPSVVTFNNEKLIFNGGGAREKMDINLYVAALYLKSKQSDRSAILKNNNTLLIKMQVVSELVTKEKMATAIEVSFDKSLGGNKNNYRKEIDLFKFAFKDEIAEGDKFDVAYIHGKGVCLFKNGVQKVTISKEGFKEGVFDIWLGENPIQEDLRDGLLGK